MDEKPIMIDGVDIKNCKRRIGKDNYCRYYKRLCSENNFNCIWKKYLRKAQECEDLKKDVERWKSNFNGKVSVIKESIKIIQQALEDFSIEVGTPQYDRLLNGAKSLGIEVNNGTNP